MSTYSNEYRKGVREEIARRLPWISSSLVDRFTGKYLLDRGQTIEMKSPLALFLTDIVVVGAMVSAIAMAWTHLSPGWAVLAGYYPTLLLVGTLRKMQTLYGHEASPGHDNFFPRGHRLRDSDATILGLSLNDFLAALATSLAWSQNEEDYGRDHGQHHDMATFGTLRDADARAIHDLGFRPGMPVGALWRRFWWTLVSPRVHGQMLVSRMRSNWDSPTKVRRFMALAVAALLLGLLAVMPVAAWIAAVLLPWTVLFHVSGLVQVLNRHGWLEKNEGFDDVQDYADRMVGRFSGVPLPREGLTGVGKVGAWALWWGEILLLELPIRIFSWSFDLQAHDFHHLEWFGPAPFVDDWTTMPQRRQAAIDEGRDPFGMRNRELWGWRSAMRHSFDRMSRSQPIA